MWKEADKAIDCDYLVREWDNDDESKEIMRFTVTELLGEKTDVLFHIYFRVNDFDRNFKLANMFTEKTSLRVIRVGRRCYSGNFSSGEGDVVEKFLEWINNYSPMPEKMKTQIQEEIYSADELMKHIDFKSMKRITYTALTFRTK